MKILNFGSCNIDYVYSVDHMVREGETISADNMEVFSGGKGLNQSIAAARAGADIYHAGCIGTGGDFLKDMLLESGADVSYLRKEDISNGHAIIQLDKNGENSICIYKGSNGMISEEHIDSVLDNFERGDILLLQNEINNLPYLIEKGFEKGLQIVFNPSPFVDELRKIDLNHISYLILNEVEASGFSGKENAAEFIDYVKESYPNLKVVVTLGKKGCIYSDKDQTLRQSAFKVNAVDTTAAGDTFTGYFVSLVSAGADYAKAIKYASAASALAVSKKGAAPSIPVFEDVEKALPDLAPSDAQ